MEISDKKNAPRKGDGDTKIREKVHGRLIQDEA
jgi:hypothetical protein